MALSPDFLDELRVRTPIAAVIGRRVRLSKSGRNWKGCCPFHGEKTPSFYVYDDHFHCFGCGAHGDVVSFVMQSQGAGFLEAVEQLAAEAGLDMPKPSREEARQAEARAGLHDILAAAAAFYTERLFQPEGRRSLDYLLNRGLSEATIRRFGLGWAPARGSLAAAMAKLEISVEQLAEAGLLRVDEESGVSRRPWEQFHERVMFPIRDRRGRIISFGGRILGDGQPKYVNGPETSVFSKRRSLYALDIAREGVRGGAALVAVEGYMDVIALHQAGFGGAVAPLGTALTEEQMEALWQLSPAPVLCFDGDAAGARAALRAAELALPLLTTERTLHVARLPPGEDPDSLIRARGAAAFTAVLEDARSRGFADALFGMLREGQALETPEQRAVFQRRLNDAAGRIADKTLAGEYRTALREKFYALRQPAWMRRRGRPGNGRGPAGWQGGGYAPHRIAPDVAAGMAAVERLRILIAIVLSHPVLLHDVEEAFAHLDLPDWLDKLRAAILAMPDHTDMLDSARLIDHLQRSGLGQEVGRVLAPYPFPLPACARPDDTIMPAEAEAAWWHIFGFLHQDRLDQEVEAAARAWAENEDEQSERRLKALVQARDKVRRGESDEAEA